MPCYSPLHGFKGKSDDPQKINLVFKRKQSWRGERLDLPCGQCVGCRLERSRQWAVRCMHEASLYDENSFVTLTYSPEKLPVSPGYCIRCEKTHVISGSLCVSVFQDFMKRLRKRYGQGIRFYHCGEYGEKFGRPHYHALLFNHGFADKQVISERGGNRIFFSQALSDLWPFGYSSIGDVTFQSAAYVARYVMKKVTGEPAEDHYKGKLPEYTTMSRRPGIGQAWFNKFKSDVYPLDRVIVRGVSTRPPRFYDNLLGREDPALLAKLKIDREKASRIFVDDYVDGRKIKVSDQDCRRLRVKEEVKLAQLKNLKRSLED